MIVRTTISDTIDLWNDEWYFQVRQLASEDKSLFHTMLSEFPNPNFRVIGLLTEAKL
jgi:hypothetical protein